MTSYSSVTSFQSSTTTSSAAPLHRAQPTKDYSAAFAALQSTYGMNGFAPKPVDKRPAHHTSAAHTVSLPARSEYLVPATPVSHRKPAKDFEATFASLSSSYGFAGQVPCLPPKVGDRPRSRCSLVSRVFSKNAKSLSEN